MAGYITLRASVWFLSVAGLLAIGIFAGSAVTASSGRFRVLTNRSVPLLVSTGVAQADGSAPVGSGFASVLEQVLPAVVNISSSKIVWAPETGPSSPFFSDPFFRHFLGDEFSRQYHGPRERRERSLGSGVIVSPEGVRPDEQPRRGRGR